MSEAPAPDGALYPSLLGAAWPMLDAAIQRVHGAAGAVAIQGTIDVVGASNWLGRALARLLRLPRAGKGLPMTLHVVPKHGGETWRRSFAGKPLVTWQGRDARGRMLEHFGLLEMAFRLSVSAGALDYAHVGTALRLGRLHLPLPSFLAPKITARETSDGPKTVHMVVEVRLPVAGLLIAYRGRLEV